jgi:hypothetical protein
MGHRPGRAVGAGAWRPASAFPGRRHTRHLSSALPASSSRPAGNRARGEQNDNSIWVANCRDSYLSVRCRLCDVPGGAAKAEAGKPVECRLDVNEERQQQESAPSRRGRRSFRDAAVEQVELQDAGVVVGKSRVTEETARRLRLGASRRPGQSPSTCRSCSSSRPRPSR